MKTLFVRIAPQAGPEKFFSCGIEFSRAWKAVNDLDNATVARLKIEQMLETSETQPAGYTPAGTPVSGGDTSAVNGGEVLGGFGGGKTVTGSGIPMVLPSSGSVGTNGALTLTTPLVHTYANAYMYFPAGAVFAGSPAGMYYVKMAGGAVGTIYNNVYVGGKPSIPAVPAPIVAAAPGAYTQTTNFDVTLISSVLPGGNLGPSGTFACYPMVSANNSANSKTFKLFVNNVAVMAQGMTAVATEMRPFRMANQGVENSQMTSTFIGLVASASVMVPRAIDTSVANGILYTASLANALDHVTLCSYQEETSFF